MEFLNTHNNTIESGLEIVAYVRPEMDVMFSSFIAGASKQCSNTVSLTDNLPTVRRDSTIVGNVVRLEKDGSPIWSSWAFDQGDIDAIVIVDIEQNVAAEMLSKSDYLFAGDLTRIEKWLKQKGSNARVLPFVTTGQYVRA